MKRGGLFLADLPSEAWVIYVKRLETALERIRDRQTFVSQPMDTRAYDYEQIAADALDYKGNERRTA